MNTTFLRVAMPALLLAGLPAGAATLYVDVNSTNPVPPYTNWATAANLIQDAVDAASAGDTVLVTNGVYATGGKAVYGTMTNRVALDKPLTLTSVNGMEFTIIKGYQLPGITNGDGATRCVYLTNGASLIGFTLTNGATGASGDYDRERSGGGLWCESTNVWVSNCVVVRNSASRAGGGASSGTLVMCELEGNSSGEFGGGCFGSALFNCAVVGNSAASGGGGVMGGSLINCTVTGNFSPDWGGGVASTKANNSIIYFNTSALDSIKANHFGSVLNFCCTTPLPTNGVGNISSNPQLASRTHLSADSPCRGAGATAYVSGMDLDGEPWKSPPSMGCDEYQIGSVTGPLEVAMSTTYLSVATGFRVSLTAEIEGRTTASTWDFGDGTAVSNQPFAQHYWTAPGDHEVVLRAYNESWPDGLSHTTALHVVEQPVHHVAAAATNPVAPFTNWATAANRIQDAVDAAMVPGALILVAEGIYASGGKAAHGTMTNRVAVDKPLTLLSVNGPESTIIQGYQVPATTNGDAAIRCVYLTNGAILSGFTLTNGATRTSGQYTEVLGGGVYCESLDAVVSNCVVIGNASSGCVFGTFWDCSIVHNWALNGGGSYGSVLHNSSLVSNSAAQFGGGSFWGSLSNCNLAGNSAGDSGGGSYGTTLKSCTLTNNSAEFGGGCHVCTLTDCRLIGNSARQSGGGSSSSDLRNCLLVANHARVGGGSAQDVLNGCTLVGNSAELFAGGFYFGTAATCVIYYNSAGMDGHDIYYFHSLDYSCTSMQTSGTVGNITNAPLFVDTNGWADLRLQSNSPCVNAGNNAHVTTTNDLDGNPRIMGGTVDMGAYEFQLPQSVISYAWLQQYGLPTDGSVDDQDGDNDKASTWQEWKAWTDPTNALSVLRMLNPDHGTNGATVSWQSVSGHSYQLDRAIGAEGTFSVLQSNVVGQAGTTIVTDTNAVGDGPFFYRVGVSAE